MIISVDCETTGLQHWLKDRPFAVAIYFEDKLPIYYEGKVDPFSREVKWDEKDLQKLRKYLCDESIKKVFHNAKFDIYMLNTIGIPVRGKIHDTYYAAKVCNTLEATYKLKSLARKYLGITNDDEKDLKKQIIRLRKEGKKRGYSLGESVESDYWLYQHFPEEKNLCKIYCIQDVKRTLELWQFYEEGMKELNVRHTYDFEMEKLFSIVMNMEKRGIRINLKSLNKQILNVHLKIAEHEKKLPPNINLNSPIQVSELLFRKLRLPSLYKTKGGKDSTETETLLKLKDECNGNTEAFSVLDNIIYHRALENGKKYLQDYLHNSIVDNTITWDDWQDWKPFCIHPNFDQIKAKTFRFACSMPNLQNVPNPETSSGQYVIDGRNVFIPREGYIFFCPDYSQLELRIWADRSNDEYMINAIKQGKDPHDANRLRCYPDMPQEQGRKLAKNVVYTLIFMGGANVLWRKYRIPLHEGYKLINDFKKASPSTEIYSKILSKKGLEDGFILNAFGRRIDIDPNFAYRGVNYDIQSSASDLIKRAMVKIAAYLEENGYDAHILLQVHDELVIEVNKQCFHKTFIRDITDIMQDDEGAFDIPIAIDHKASFEHWGKKVKVNI